MHFCLTEGLIALLIEMMMMWLEGSSCRTFSALTHCKIAFLKKFSTNVWGFYFQHILYFYKVKVPTFGNTLRQKQFSIICHFFQSISTSSSHQFTHKKVSYMDIWERNQDWSFSYCHSLVLILILISIKTWNGNIFGQKLPPHGVGMLWAHLMPPTNRN